LKKQKLKSVVEALLMISTKPLSPEKIHQLVDEPGVNLAGVKQALVALQEDYQARGVELKEIASGFRFQVVSAYQKWFNRLLQDKPQRYSKALLETLAIVAYRQPVTRADIESIRGVAVSSNIMRTLQEREWIRCVGQRDLPGKPSVYATTKIFLDYFGLISLSDLPSLPDIKALSDVMNQGEQALVNLQQEKELET
jgi:segregation and condensation protein B